MTEQITLENGSTLTMLDDGRATIGSLHHITELSASDVAAISAGAKPDQIDRYEQRVSANLRDRLGESEALLFKSESDLQEWRIACIRAEKREAAALDEARVSLKDKLTAAEERIAGLESDLRCMTHDRDQWAKGEHAREGLARLARTEEGYLDVIEESEPSELSRWRLFAEAWGVECLRHHKMREQLDRMMRKLETGPVAATAKSSAGIPQREDARASGVKPTPSASIRGGEAEGSICPAHGKSPSATYEDGRRAGLREAAKLVEGFCGGPRPRDPGDIYTSQALKKLGPMILAKANEGGS